MKKSNLNNDKSLMLNAISNFLSLAKSREISIELLENLLTDSEIKKIYDRIKILDCLEKNFSQRATLKKVGGGIATVSRGAQLVKSENFATFKKLLANARQQSWWQTLFWRR